LLLAKEIYCIREWSEWEELWGRAFPAEFLHSLLHFGFEIDCDYDEAVKRICLYLKIADESSDSYFFSDNPGVKDRYYSNLSRFGRKMDGSGDLRKELSRKAFQMLSQGFFKDTTEKSVFSSCPSWGRFIINPQVFSKLLWFFRLSEGGKTLNLYHAGGHNAEIANEFAKRFSLLPWGCDELSYLESLEGKTKDMFRQAKASMIEILFGLKKLDFLIKEDRYARIDKKCMNKLKDLALGFKITMPNQGRGTSFRKPKTIEEACFGGSQAAQVFLILQVMQEENARFDELNKLNEQFRKAEEGIKNLTS